jgi:hypothetical protein
MWISEGRGFRAEDGPGQPQVLLINRTLARSGLLGPNPVGQQIYAVGSLPWEVIGIVEDARQIGLDQEPGPQLFIDFRQFPGDVTNGVTGSSPPYFAVLTTGAPASMTASVREIVRQIDPRATLDSVATMVQIAANSIVRQRGAARRVRAGGGDAGDGGHLRRAVVRGGTAHARDWDPHGAGREPHVGDPDDPA